MNDNLILIGFMGAGKTCIGTLLAEKHRKIFKDTDQVITEKIGMSIGDFFQKQGEMEFRNLETQVLREGLSNWNNCVISVGGGLPLREDNRKLLKDLGHVIYLKIQPETVLERLRGDVTRPLLQKDDKEAKVRALLSEREPIYRESASMIITVDQKTPEEIVREIEEIIRRNG